MSQKSNLFLSFVPNSVNLTGPSSFPSPLSPGLNGPVFPDTYGFTLPEILVFPSDSDGDDSSLSHDTIAKSAEPSSSHEKNELNPSLSLPPTPPCLNHPCLTYVPTQLFGPPAPLLNPSKSSHVAKLNCFLQVLLNLPGINEELPASTDEGFELVKEFALFAKWFHCQDDDKWARVRRRTEERSQLRAAAAAATAKVASVSSTSTSTSTSSIAVKNTVSSEFNMNGCPKKQPSSTSGLSSSSASSLSTSLTTNLSNSNNSITSNLSSSSSSSSSSCFSSTKTIDTTSVATPLLARDWYTCPPSEQSSTESLIDHIWTPILSETRFGRRFNFHLKHLQTTSVTPPPPQVLHHVNIHIPSSIPPNSSISLLSALARVLGNPPQSTFFFGPPDGSTKIPVQPYRSVFTTSPRTLVISISRDYDKVAKSSNCNEKGNENEDDVNGNENTVPLLNPTDLPTINIETEIDLGAHCCLQTGSSSSSTTSNSCNTSQTCKNYLPPTPTPQSPIIIPPMIRSDSTFYRVHGFVTRGPQGEWVAYTRVRDGDEVWRCENGSGISRAKCGEGGRIGSKGVVAVVYIRRD